MVTSSLPGAEVRYALDVRSLTGRRSAVVHGADEEPGRDRGALLAVHLEAPTRGHVHRLAEAPEHTHLRVGMHEQELHVVAVLMVLHFDERPLDGAGRRER